jgi:hypothetical protein
VHRGEHSDPACMSQYQRASNVLGVKEVLDDDAVGTMRVHQPGELGVNVVQARGQRRAGRRPDGAACHKRVDAAV